MATVSSGSPSERFGFIQAHGKRLGVKYLCSWLKVSRSGYYAWRNRSESLRAIADEELLAHINRVFVSNKQTYGSPRVFHALKREGILKGRPALALFSGSIRFVFTPSDWLGIGATKID